MTKEKYDTDSFAPNLLYLRNKASLSQSDLASIIGVDHTIVSHWENGRRTPRLKNVMRLAGALGVSHEDLFLDHDVLITKYKELS